MARVGATVPTCQVCMMQVHSQHAGLQTSNYSEVQVFPAYNMAAAPEVNKIYGNRLEYKHNKMVLDKRVQPKIAIQSQVAKMLNWQS